MCPPQSDSNIPSHCSKIAPYRLSVTSVLRLEGQAAVPVHYGSGSSHAVRNLKCTALEVLDLRVALLRMFDLNGKARYFALLIGLTGHSDLALTESYTRNQYFLFISRSG
jgi:hypothetical protein